VATPALTNEELIELEQLRVKHEKLKQKSSKAAAPVKNIQAAAAAKKKVKAASSGSSSDSEVSLS